MTPDISRPVKNQPGNNTYLKELAAIIKLALPLLITQLGISGIGS